MLQRKSLVLLSWFLAVAVAGFARAGEEKQPTETKATAESDQKKPDAEKPAAEKSGKGKPAEAPDQKKRHPESGKKPGKGKPTADADQKKGGGKHDLVKEEEREAAALAFAAQHHAELVALIEQLKATNPAEYQRAIRELAKTNDRLTQIKQRDPKRYALELDAWKITSRVRLIVARLMMAREPSLEQELREVLAQQIDIRVQLLLLEREEANARLQKLDAAIETARTLRDEQVHKNFDNVIRSLTKPAEKTGKPAKGVAQGKPGKKVPGKNETVKSDPAKTDAGKTEPDKTTTSKAEAPKSDEKTAVDSKPGTESGSSAPKDK